MFPIHFSLTFLLFFFRLILDILKIGSEMLLKVHTIKLNNLLEFQIKRVMNYNKNDTLAKRRFVVYTFQESSEHDSNDSVFPKGRHNMPSMVRQIKSTPLIWL